MKINGISLVIDGVQEHFEKSKQMLLNGVIILELKREFTMNVGHNFDD